MAEFLLDALVFRVPVTLETLGAIVNVMSHSVMSQKCDVQCVDTLTSKHNTTDTHLDMCFGLVEQSQCGVPTAVWSQRDEGFQPLQTQAEMCSSVTGETQS